MAVHLTPLKRSQLLDLERLVMSAQRSSSFSSLMSTSDISNNNNSGDNVPVYQCPFEHPFASGTFCDVFEDPLTRHTWRLYDKMLYIVWWSYRPSFCTGCGMQDAWMPSADSEMKCWHCGTGAGTTSLNDIVEDVPAMVNEDEDDDDGDNMENDVDGNAAEGGAVVLYMFFYEWLSRMPLMECGKGIVIPKGESLPAVLRAAYDLALLFITPGLPNGGVTVLQGGALYLSLVLHRFPAPFPLFRLASYINTSNDLWNTATPTTTSFFSTINNTITTTNNSNNKGGVSSGGEQREELQWVDVELLAALIGVSLSDFFESSQVAVQYLQNVMTVAAAFAVPSVIWHPQRVEGRTEYMMSLRKKQRRSSPLHSTVMSSGFSPENTAMIVALELARVFDAHPCSTKHAERIGLWLDQHGLYPQRSIYRSGDNNNNNNIHNNTNNNTNNTTSGHNNEDQHRTQQPLASGCDVLNEMNAATTLSTKEVGVIDSISWASPLTTDASPFAGVMQLVLLSPCANALLYVFANVFSMSALELADMAVSSGLYNGPTRFFEVLREASESGNYSLMPLFRRLSPITSVWTSAYFAVHSEDRLPLLTALQHIRAATTREKETPLVRIIQRILRKHQASRRYRFNYSIRVTDDSEKQQFKGVYFLSYVTERFAVYTGVRSARKTVTFDAETGKITLCLIGSKEQQVESLNVQFNGPIVVNIETESAKCVIDCVRQSIGAESWQLTVRHLNRGGRVRRRMRVPMLASRLEALASVREATAMASHPIAGTTTLLGWGETEVLFTSLPRVHSAMYAVGLRHELQQNLLFLPKPSLVFGISENRVIAMYASLVALLEHIEQQISRLLRGQPTSSSLFFPPSGSSVTWVDILLSHEESKSEMSHVCASPRSKELAPVHMNNANGILGSPVQLPASTATIKREHQQQQYHHHHHHHHAISRQTQLRGREVKSFPTYEEVMLGLDDCSDGVNDGNNNSNSSRNRLPPSGRVRTAVHRDRRQRRACTQQRTRLNTEEDIGHTTSTVTLGANCSSFNLFSAEECRRRLYRLLQFIAVYTTQRKKREKTTAAVVGSSTTPIVSETNGIVPTVETSPTARKVPLSPCLNHHSQQSLPPLNEKTTLKHNVPSIRNSSSSPLLPQSSPRHTQTSMGKPNASPTIEASQQQSINNLHRRPCHSRAAPVDRSEDDQQGGRSPVKSVVVNSGQEKLRRQKKHSRVRNNNDRRGDANEKDCGNRDERIVATLPLSRSSSSSTSSSSMRSSSVCRSSSNSEGNLHRRKRRRCR